MTSRTANLNMLNELIFIVFIVCLYNLLDSCTFVANGSAPESVASPRFSREH